MNLFSKRFIHRHQTKLFFFVIWLHVSLLDLLYVSHRGPVFLYKESLQVNALLTHVFIALVTLGCAMLVSKFLRDKQTLLNKGSIDNQPKFTAEAVEKQ